MSTNNTYWATELPDDLAIKCTEKVDEYRDFTLRNGVLDRWKRAYLAYYGLSESGSNTSRLNQAGTNGEQFVLKVNHFRSILQSLLVLITQSPPALQPRASNTDSKSMNQTILAKSVLDYYMTQAGMESRLAKAAEFSLYSGEGFISMLWNATAGSIFAIGPNGNPIYDGDLDVKAYHPIDVIRETNNYSSENTSPWYITREWINKYDLAAKFPELEDEITSLSTVHDSATSYRYNSINSSDSDQIPLYTFYHEKSNSLPNGRQFSFLSSNLYLTDGPLAYKRLPIYRMAPSNWDGSCFGYTVAYDMMGIQKNYDALMSIVTTNQMNYGVQNIVATRGSELNVVALGQGLNLIETNAGTAPPAALNLLSTSPEIFSQMNNLIKQMETISGINSTARGNPEESLKSGTALALVAAQAIQFNSGLQASYNNLIQAAGTSLIEILQLYALTPRIAAIAGRSNRSRIKEFKGEDLDSITRVTVESVNPISKTAAGRLQMAQDLLQMPGMVKTPQHYLEIIETGTLEPLIEHETSQMLLIRSENEDLADGKSVNALVTDQHQLHIHEHSTVLDSPEARENPALIKLTTDHIMQHISLLRTTDSQLLMVLGQQPLPPEPAPGIPPQGGPPPGAPIPQGPKSGPALGDHAIPPVMGNGSPAVEQKAATARKPELPNVPKSTPPNLAASYEKLKSNLS